MENTLIVSPWEFRARQKTYLEKIDRGWDILIRSRRKSYRVVTAEDASDPCRMTKEEFDAKIDTALREATDGKGVVLRGKSEIKEYFDSL